MALSIIVFELEVRLSPDDIHPMSGVGKRLEVARDGYKRMDR